MSFQDELKSRMRDAGLGSVAEQVARLARPCYRIGRTLVPDDQISVGSSKFGGGPDVPAGFTWPEVANTRKPEPMEFVGQIRLSDLPAPLPENAPQDGI